MPDVLSQRQTAWIRSQTPNLLGVWLGSKLFEQYHLVAIDWKKSSDSIMKIATLRRFCTDPALVQFFSLFQSQLCDLKVEGNAN